METGSGEMTWRTIQDELKKIPQIDVILLDTLWSADYDGAFGELDDEVIFFETPLGNHLQAIAPNMRKMLESIGVMVSQSCTAGIKKLSDGWHIGIEIKGLYVSHPFDPSLRE